MNLFLQTQDFLILFIVPLMVKTILDLRKNWASIADDDVTQKDREITMRCTIFLFLPIAVLIHEGAHALATIAFGGRVVEFHYGILWGYVIPEGRFTDQQLFLIYLAGNALELIIGVIALIACSIVRKPALIVLLTYFGLWTIGSTIVFYPALSLVGMYGDWIAIYSSPFLSGKAITAICHALLVAILAWLVYGQTARLWFVRKTDRQWNDAYCTLVDLASTDSDPKNYLRLAWLFYEARLNSLAQQFVTKFVSLSSQNPEAKLLAALLLERRGKIKQANLSLQELLADPRLPSTLTPRIKAILEQFEQSHGKQ